MTIRMQNLERLTLAEMQEFGKRLPERTWSPPCSRSSTSPCIDAASSGRWPERKKKTLAMAGHDDPIDRTAGPEQATRYEDLRRHVIGHGSGHLLFHREGMKAWLDAWSTCTTRDARPLRDASGDPDWVTPVTLARRSRCQSVDAAGIAGPQRELVAGRSQAPGQ